MYHLSNRHLAKAAVRGGCDGLMLENAACIEEAQLQLDGVTGLDIPLILSFEGALRTLDRDPDLSLVSLTCRKVNRPSN